MAKVSSTPSTVRLRWPGMTPALFTIHQHVQALLPAAKPAGERMQRGQAAQIAAGRPHVERPGGPGPVPDQPGRLPGTLVVPGQCSL